MVWQGKALGTLVGVVAAGPMGAVFGMFIGHLFDVELQSRRQPVTSGAVGTVGVQEAFFRATFQVMGHVAKADGRVTEDKIRAARAIMGELRLGEREVGMAIELFTAGKAKDYPLDKTLQRLQQLCRERPDLCRMFVQIQLQAALWGGSLNAAARQTIARVCGALDVSSYELVQMEALLRMQQSARQTQSAKVDRLAEAYAVLGVMRQAEDADVVIAYRRLMNQNHPDKLHAKGLPESMMKMAEEKTRQIRAAYEVIRESRGMR
jgi:DnaJ like chaperone protein